MTPGTTTPNGKRLLVISQTFVPDPASVGQHMTDVAVEMARRGWDVRVYASAWGYDDATIRYPKREVLHGVDIRRISFGSFGKKNILIRALGTFSFQFQALMRSLFTPNVSGIFFSTSPPLIGVVACLVGLLRGIPVAYWAMDLNPDQLIAMGKLTPTSSTARFLEAANRWILKRSALVVALDRFMADRLSTRATLTNKLLIAPPWSHDDQLEVVTPQNNPFIVRNELAGKFVIMYSGNHSPANPLQTLLEAAAALKDDDSIRFLFVGGGTGKKGVEQFIRDHQIKNALCLPYQPLADLRYSLTSADVHIVSLGQQMAGIVHPCKIYGAMATGKPVLFLGPSPSHISDILDRYPIGWHIKHGDVPAAIETIKTIKSTDPTVLTAMGKRGQEILQSQLSQTILCGQFCDRLEAAINPPAK